MNFPFSLFSPPSFHFFLTASSIQLNCFSVGHASYPPSIPLLPSTCVGCLEKAVTVSFPLLLVTPHSKLFLTASFSNQIAIPSTVPAALPQSIKRTRSHHKHPCVACCMEKMVTVSFPLFILFSSNFSHRIFVS